MFLIHEIFNYLILISVFFFFQKNIEYNNLINEQNQIKRQTDSALKQHNGIQQMYNLLMNKLNKGKHLASVLSELVMRIQTYKY